MVVLVLNSVAQEYVQQIDQDNSYQGLPPAFQEKPGAVLGMYCSAAVRCLQLGQHMVYMDQIISTSIPRMQFSRTAHHGLKSWMLELVTLEHIWTASHTLQMQVLALEE